MPLYDCVMPLKPHVKKESLMNLVSRVGRHVCAWNGVLTDIKSFGTVQLGYSIKKLDGRYFQIEGATFEDGRKASIFDTYAHVGFVSENGDVAAEGYHKYKEDVQLMVET